MTETRRPRLQRRQAAIIASTALLAIAVVAAQPSRAGAFPVPTPTVPSVTTTDPSAVVRGIDATVTTVLGAAPSSPTTVAPQPTNPAGPSETGGTASTEIDGVGAVVNTPSAPIVPAIPDGLGHKLPGPASVPSLISPVGKGVVPPPGAATPGRLAPAPTPGDGALASVGPTAAAIPRRTTGPQLEMARALGLSPTQLNRLLAPFPVAAMASYTDQLTEGGVDLTMPEGGPAIASASGTLQITPDGGTAAITTAGGAVFAYTGLVRIISGVHTGDSIRKGDVIGFAGRHLLFEIRPPGQADVSPVPYLDRWLAESSAGITARSRAEVPSQQAFAQAAQSALSKSPLLASTPVPASDQGPDRQTRLISVRQIPVTVPVGYGVLIIATLVVATMMFLATLVRLRARRLRWRG